MEIFPRQSHFKVSQENPFGSSMKRRARVQKPEPRIENSYFLPGSCLPASAFCFCGDPRKFASPINYRSPRLVIRDKKKVANTPVMAAMRKDQVKVPVRSAIYPPRVGDRLSPSP